MTGDLSGVNICFHGIGTPPRALESGEDEYWITKETFLRVLDEIAAWPDVAISLDDGNASDVEIALPALEERGLHATFFLLADRLDAPGGIGRDRVASLVRGGMTIGSHGMTHRTWRGLDTQAERRELDDARTILADVAGTPVDEAACPFGLYDRKALRGLRERGYTRVHTSDRRRVPRYSWVQARFSVRAVDTPDSLRAAVLADTGMEARVRAAKAFVKRWR